MPDLTTVLTLTLTGIAADSRLADGTGGHPARRPLSIAAGLIAASALAAHRLSPQDFARAQPN